MEKQQLARLLGISPSMVSRLAKRGMPTDSVERAARWRRRHLEPGRVKGMRAGTAPPPEAPPVQAAQAPVTAPRGYSGAAPPPAPAGTPLSQEQDVAELEQAFAQSCAELDKAMQQGRLSDLAMELSLLIDVDACTRADLLPMRACLKAASAEEALETPLPVRVWKALMADMLLRDHPLFGLSDDLPDLSLLGVSDRLISLQGLDACSLFDVAVADPDLCERLMAEDEQRQAAAAVHDRTQSPADAQPAAPGADG